MHEREGLLHVPPSRCSPQFGLLHPPQDRQPLRPWQRAARRGRTGGARACPCVCEEGGRDRCVRH